MTIGDVDGDGYDDVVVGDLNDAWMYEGSASGLSSSASVTVAASGFDLAVGDSDGDGYADLVACPLSALPRRFAGSSAGLSTSGTTVGSAYGRAATLLDLDGDGVDVPANCDDLDASVYPGATERCDDEDRDEDCDGLADDDDPSGDPTTWPDLFADDDGDGAGAATATACDPGVGESRTDDDGDGDDTDDDVFPGAAEVCNAVDDDCDGLTDDADPGVDDPTASLRFADADGDGHGDVASTATEACAAPEGAVADPDDCDDGDAAVHLGADEVCGGGDQDCGGLSDDADPSTATDGMSTFYLDDDGDRFGAASEVACALPSGLVVSGDVDDNCDGRADDDDPVELLRGRRRRRLPTGGRPPRARRARLPRRRGHGRGHARWGLR